MNVNVPLPPGAVPWEQVRTRLDQTAFRQHVRHPLYRDAGVGAVSKEEYAPLWRCRQMASTSRCLICRVGRAIGASAA